MFAVAIDGVSKHFLTVAIDGVSKHLLCNVLFRTLVNSFKQITGIIHVLLVFAILVYK